MLSRSSRKKLEDELRELNIKVAEMSFETGEAAMQKLQDEIKSCKSILKCSVCSDRPKEVSVLIACKLTPLRSVFSFLAICLQDLSSLT